MSRAAVQAQLHELDPAWNASITAARSELGYDPAWWRAEVLRWTGARDDPLYDEPYWRWMRAQGQALGEVAAAAVAALALPPIFETYWCACFRTWRSEHGPTSVREFFAGRVRRAYPVGEIVSAGVHRPGDGSEASVVIRVPIRYATKAVLGSAVRHVLGLVGPDLPLAPLADGRLRKTVTARLGRVAHNAPLRARTCELAALGRSTGEIMVALATEFGADDPDRFLAERQLSVRTVQRWRRSGGDIL